MNKKTIFLISALLVVILIYFLLNRDNTKTIAKDEKDFAMQNTSQIDKIFISHRSSGKHVTLKKIDSAHWTVNDTFKVNVYQIEILFEGFKKLQVKRPVSNKEMSMVKKELAVNGIKVEIYEKGEISKVYYVGGNSTDELGTFFYMDQAKEPYLCHIPGFNGYPGARYYFLTKAWRSKTIFEATSNEISNIKVDWIEDMSHSFVIDNTGEAPVLKTTTKTFINNKESNLNSIRTYLKMWQNLSFEGFPIDLNARKIDSISKTQAILVLELTKKNGEKTKLSIHRKGIKRDSNIQMDKEGNPLQFDIETFYAFINDNNTEVVQIQDYVFGKVMKTYSDFLLKNNDKNQ